MGNGYGRKSPEKKLVGRECSMEGLHGFLQVWREVECEEESSRGLGGRRIHKWLMRQVTDKIGVGRR